ncbi:thiol reductant ABC exporter subunit CydC [Leucobacter sp. HNU]|uniref:thiol reductant ABC exporter subunit CydC n=1 Tax=Leucobacter sp. HNU TaxID=3236805 RepID=UPI003A811122
MAHRAGGGAAPILHLTFAIVGVRALAIGRAAFRYAERLASHRAALTQLSELRVHAYERLVPRIPGAIEDRRRGEVLGAFVDDVDQLQDLPLRVRQPIVTSGIVIVLSLIAMAIVSPLAALVLALALAGSGVLAVRWSSRIAAESDRELGAARAALLDALLERFRAAETLAAFGALGRQRERISAAESELSRVQLRRARAAGLSAAVLGAAAGIASIAILLLLAPVTGQGLSAPLFAAAVVVPAAVFEVFALVPTAFVARRTAMASAERVAELIETPLPAEIPVDAVVEDRSDRAPDPSAPLLEVRGLSAAHPGASAAAFSGVSFALRPGETLVVSGQSGAGKSTLAAALVRFLEYSGSYLLRGREARALPQTEVRALVGLCEQTPHLFDADLRQNLRFAKPDASDQELLAVLDRVRLGDWVRERGGLDAQVGERGSLVSGGQAQRIALARAILAEFPVVILDEPTAGVDREVADALLADLLGALPDDRAAILITHTELPVGVRANRIVL